MFSLRRALPSSTRFTLRAYATKPAAKKNVSASTADRADSKQKGPYQPADYTTEVNPEGLGALPGQGGKQGELTNESGSKPVDSQARSRDESRETVKGPLATAGKETKTSKK